MENILTEVFQKALVIDDKKEEVDNLISHLEKKNIKTVFIEPNDENSDDYFKKFNGFPGNLIFLDLYLNSMAGAEIRNHIAKIRGILTHIIGKRGIAYGIIVWSSHSDEIKLLQEKLLEDVNDYILPLFIFGMDKEKYKIQPDEIFVDIASRLKDNVAASFYIKWSNSIEKAKSKVLSDIFGLVQGYEYQNKNLEFLLFQMAKNHIGISDEDLSGYDGLQKDAFNAFSELLSDDLKYFIPDTCNLFSEMNLIEYTFKENEEDTFSKKGSEYLKNKIALGKKDPDREKIDSKIFGLYASLNSKILLDFTDFGIILPGNVYVNNNPCIYSNKMEEGDIPIIIELSPPCDFANKKKYAMPKFVSGFITKYDKVKEIKGDALYTETYPLLIPKIDEQIYAIVFDFRYVNNISEKELSALGNEFIFRVKDKLFADILQKMSSYTARLGLSIIR